MNNLALIMATTGDQKLRDGPASVPFGEQANELIGYNLPEQMDTLAPAYAQAGRFPEAIPTARKAMDLARRGGKTELFEEIAARLRLYQAGLPTRVAFDNSDPPAKTKSYPESKKASLPSSVRLDK